MVSRQPGADPARKPGSPWFHWVAEQAGLVFFVLRVHPDVSVEFLSDGALTTLIGAGPAVIPVGAEELLAHVHPHSADALDALLRLEPGQSTPVELTWRSADGEAVHTRGWVQSRRREDASAIIEGALQDVSEFTKVEVDLRRSEERHRLLAENAWDVIWTMGLDGAITYVSPAVERVRGISPAQAMSQTLEEIHPPASAASDKAYYERLFTAIADGDEPPGFRGEHEYYRSDGSIMTGELQVIPHVTPECQVVEILGVTRDISERKQVEAAQALYHRLVDSSFVATNLTRPGRPIRSGQSGDVQSGRLRRRHPADHVLAATDRPGRCAGRHRGHRRTGRRPARVVSDSEAIPPCRRPGDLV